MRQKSIHKYKFISPVFSFFFFLYGYPFCIFIFLNKSVNIFAEMSKVSIYINSHFEIIFVIIV